MNQKTEIGVADLIPITDRSLPASFVESGLELAEGSTLFGIKFHDMTRIELIAAAAHGWNEERKSSGELSVYRARLFTEKSRRSGCSDATTALPNDQNHTGQDGGAH